MSTRCRVALVCLLLGPVGLLAQAPADPETPPTFRAGVTHIEVDVVVTDRHGFVRDLVPDDFEIYDDGVRQAIASFALVDLPAPWLQPRWTSSGTTPATTFTGDAITPEGRVYAMLLDMSGARSNPAPRLLQPVDHARRVQRLSRQFLDEAMGPDDLMSVSFVQGSTMLVQELTHSRPLLRSAIDAFGTGRPWPGTLDARTDAARGAWTAYRALREVAEDLGAVTGRRKAILWIGGQVPFHHGSPDTAIAYREALRAAARHNVTIYPIDPTGLTTRLAGWGPISGESCCRGFLDARSPSDLLRLAGLRAAAEDTGGIAVVNTNNFSGGFRRIVDANSTYYLLGYYPTVDAQDDRFHEIRVRVNRPGVSVRARRGYFAAPPAPVLPLEEELVADLSPARQAIHALDGLERRELLHLRTASWVPDPDAGARALWILGELDPQARRERAWSGGGTAEVLLRARDGTTVFSSETDLPASDRAAFALDVSHDAGLAPGEYTLRVRVSAGESVSHAETRTVRVGDDASPLGEALFWRRGPATGPRYVPTADPRFRRTEMLRLELPTISDLPVAARMLDRAGAPLPIPLPIDTRREGERTWILVTLPLAALAPADYVVEITQAGATQLAAFRMVP